MAQWFLDLHPAWQALVRVLLFLLPVLMLVPGLIWWERRLLSWMQDRIGPNRVATITWSKTSKMVPGFLRGKKTKFFGLLQPIADGVKLFFKEDVTPSASDRFLYFVAPGIALFPAFALGGTLPWAPWRSLTPIADVNIGILYVLAISSLGVYGVVLAGYSGNNKYSLMGGLRASAQLISYELAMGMSLACIVLATGSLKMTDMIKAQEGAFWGALPWAQNWFVFTPYGFVAMVVFMICMVAETNRAPFDLPEAENELIAGYHTEYSSMKFAVFFMGEYAAMFVFSGVLTSVFFGGYNMAPFNWDYMAQNAPPFWASPASLAEDELLAGAALVYRQDRVLYLRLHLASRHAPPPTIRPADVSGLEIAPPPRQPSTSSSSRHGSWSTSTGDRAAQSACLARSRVLDFGWSPVSSHTAFGGSFKSVPLPNLNSKCAPLQDGRSGGRGNGMNLPVEANSSRRTWAFSRFWAESRHWRRGGRRGIQQRHTIRTLPRSNLLHPGVPLLHANCRNDRHPSDRGLHRRDHGALPVRRSCCLNLGALKSLFEDRDPKMLIGGVLGLWAWRHS